VLLTLFEWLRETTFSTDLRESIYMWAVVNGIHVLGLGLFMGMLLFWDLRLLNVGLRKVPVQETWDRLAPWIGLGFLVMVVSGVLLFVSDPVRFWGNIFFRMKLVALVLAGLNAAAFHFTVGKRVVDWDRAGQLPGSAKFVGAASLVLWAFIIVSGRLIAYSWFEPLV
jgi:hypothetical protein